MAVELLAARRAPAEAGAGRPVTATSAPAPRPVPPEQPRQEEPRREEPPREEPARPQPSFEAQPAGFEPQPVAAEPEPEPAFRAEPQAEPSFNVQPAPAPASGGQTEFSQAESFTSAPPAPEPAAPISPLGSARRYGSMDMDFPVEVSEEEKRYHNEARRFARLLVSEIKLYNEQKVREGRDSSDLYERLREDIDRSRQMYDKRVRPEVSSRYDYFDHELVNMLAEGDRNKLGADYPGATVNA
jgi:hypothetical protein